jgi:hypothetical protein
LTFAHGAVVGPPRAGIADDRRGKTQRAERGVLAGLLVIADMPSVR